MYQMNGNPGTPFGAPVPGSEVQRGGVDYLRNQMGGGMPGYGFNPQPGGMPMPNPGMFNSHGMGYGGGYPAMGRIMFNDDGMGYGGGYPGMGQMQHQSRPGQMLRYGGGYPDMGRQVSGIGNQMGYGPRPMPIPDMGRLPMPDGGGMSNPGFMGGMMPRPDGGGMSNPGMGIPQRDFANNNPFYNAKGNLRMRYRPGGQMAGMAPPQFDPNGTY